MQHSQLFGGRQFAGDIQETNISPATTIDRVVAGDRWKRFERGEKHRKPVVLVLVLVLSVIAALSRFASAEQTPWMHIPENSFDQGWGLLDLDRLWDTGRWQVQNALSGSWGGTREQLCKYGIAVLGSYEGEFATNPVGGDLHNARYCDTLGVAPFLDLQRMFNFKDTFLLASVANGWVTASRQTSQISSRRSSSLAERRSALSTWLSRRAFCKISSTLSQAG